jgi:hypothetical protein
MSHSKQVLSIQQSKRQNDLTRREKGIGSMNAMEQNTKSCSGWKARKFMALILAPYKK